MTSHIESKEGRVFLRDTAWGIAMFTLCEDFTSADQLLDQIEDEIDCAYCQGAAYGFWASLTGIPAGWKGVVVPDEDSLPLQ